MENNKLWCCANSAIELVDTVKKKENKHTNITKKNKTITGDNSANGRGNIFTKKMKQTQNWEDTNQEVTEKSHRKREVENKTKKNIKQRKEKI